MSSRHLARLQRAGAGREGSDEEESSDEGENEDSEKLLEAERTMMRLQILQMGISQVLGQVQ